MAWEWSHSQEGLDNARRQMESLERVIRETIAAEWMGTPRCPYGLFSHSNDLDMKLYRRGLKRAARWSDEKLNDMIWKKMSEYATCSNGGWEAYCCPHHCGPHTVSFSPPDETEDDE